MFTSFATLMKTPLVTTDGEEHQVCSLLFDDRSWTICFLIADAESWLSRRQVVIRTGAIDGPDWTKRSLPSTLRIRNWSNARMSVPLSRYLSNNSLH